jgi:hypothetical protein
MTPVFSEREIANIRSTRKLCGNCHGRRRVVAEIPVRFAVKNYPCKYATFYITCSICDGLGTVPATPVSDGKLAASGGVA